MKKLINDAGRVVPEMLAALVRLQPGLRLLPDAMAVVRDGPTGEVAVLSGGGAGHEPAHAGYVGPGLLRGAVSGDVFTSPSTDAVLDAIRAVGGPAGVLLVVKNYTGDRLNFGLAAELARAEGIACEMVVVADDVALAGAGRSAGRRGIAGTVLVHKVAGAAAAAGLALPAVKAEAERAAASLASIGVGLSVCTVPAAGTPGHQLGEDEIEMGLGIHGEAGVRRMPIRPVGELVDGMCGRLVGELGLEPGARIALLVNDLGATPPSELLIAAGEALRVFEAAGAVVERCWCGSFLTALDMAGCSLSAMRVDDARLERLDAEAFAAGWQQGVKPAPASVVALRRRRGTDEASAAEPGGLAGSRMETVLRAVAEALLGSEAELTRLDQAVGDGDLGISLSRGARAMLAELPSYPAAPAACLERLAGTLRRALGGTSGPLYAVFLLRAAASLSATPGGRSGLDLAGWAEAFRAGVQGIAELGDAEPGDRTMLDALVPAVQALAEAAESGASVPAALADAVRAAREGAHSTSGMVPRRGRSSYLADQVGDTPDPGAVAVWLWLEAIGRALAG